jgi:GNAT superfamily N-acetyltransferase
MVHVCEINADNPKDVKRFLDFPFQLYQDCPQWVPPMAGDARLRLDRQRYPFYRHSDATFFLATSGGATVGRIAVLEHRRYSLRQELGQEDNPQRDAFFYLFDTVDDIEVARALFDAAEGWARCRGLTHLVGPFGFAAGDPIGLLVEGFEHRAAMGITYNYSYYGPLTEACGYAKEADLVSCHMTDKVELPEKVHHLAEGVKQRRGYRVVNFRHKRELRALLPKIKQVYNETLGSFERNARLTDEEIDAVAERLISVADPTLIKVVMRGDDLVGFLFAFPDLSAAIQRCKGRLWPLGWFWLLREYKRTRWVNLNGLAVLPKYQGLGANLVLYSEMAKTLQTGRFTDADLVQTRDSNSKMLADLARMGASVYKRHRVYRKPLST